MRALLRCDAGPDVGLGHLSRCLCLAEALAKAGTTVSLAVHDPPSWLAGRGFEVVPAPVAGSAADLALMLEHVHDGLLVVTDSYHVDAEYLSALRRKGARVLALDDEARHPLPVDWVLNPGPGAEQLTYPPGTTGRMLLGPRHALLRRQVREAAVGPRQPGSVLVSLGGSDRHRQTRVVLAGLLQARGWQSASIVLGPFHGPDPEVERLAAGSRRPLTVLRDPPDLAQRMPRCELAVCAGGVTALELAALGTPALLVVVALNQVASAAALARAGCVRHLGWWEQLTPYAVAEALDELLGDPAALRAMGERGPALVDRQGVHRVVRALLERAIELEPVRIEHARLLLDWRNHPDTRRHFFDPREVPWDEHRRWLEAALADPARVLLLACAGEPAGAVRLDVAGERAVVSIYLDPARHGQGLGTRILGELPSWCRAHRPEVRILRAEVRPGNAVSLRAFEKAGYGRVLADGERVVLEREVTP